jgi:ankyrin repeat protein
LGATKLDLGINKKTKQDESDWMSNSN